MYDPLKIDLVVRLRPRAQLELEDMVRQGVINKLQFKTIATEPTEAHDAASPMAAQAAFHLAEERSFVLRQEQLLLALERMDSGLYGLCMDCKRDIEAFRLEHDVCTPLCSSCSSLRIY